MVTVEINDVGNVVDLHPVESGVAACDKRHHCKVMLHGIVRLIENGMIFIKTPVVEYELSGDMGPRDLAPGDEITLWGTKTMSCWITTAQEKYHAAAS